MNSYKPTLIVDFGTASGLCENITVLYTAKDVIQRDMSTFPLTERGIIPFDSTPSILVSVIGQYRSATGDSFVTIEDPWLKESRGSLVDMELFAIAKVCHKFQIPWRAAKYVTDTADHNAASDWSTNTANAAKVFLQNVNEFLFAGIDNELG